MAGQHQSNGSNPPPQRRRQGDYRTYEHGVAIAELAQRAHTLEEWQREIAPVIANIDRKLDQIVNRAWGVGKTIIVGGGVFFTTVSALVWLADRLGVVVSFGG